MTGRIFGFVIWSMGGIFFIAMGVYSFFSKKARPMGFWANVSMFEVTDLKQYNTAMAKLFCTYGIVFILFGLPLLAGQNSGWILLSVVGAMILSITAMSVYTIVIEKKYRKK